MQQKKYRVVGTPRVLGIWAIASVAVATVVYLIARGLGAFFAFTAAPFWIFLIACAAGVGLICIIGARS